MSLMLAKSTCRYFLANLVNHVLKLSSCYTMSKWQKSIKPANRTVINILSGHRLRRKWRNYHKSDGIELKAQTYSCFVNEISLKQKDAQPLMFALETWMIFLVKHTPAAKLQTSSPGWDAHAAVSSLGRHITKMAGKTTHGRERSTT